MEQLSAVEVIKLLQAYNRSENIEYFDTSENRWVIINSLNQIYRMIYAGDIQLRIQPKIKYRAYNTVEEFLLDSRKHGGYIKFHEGLYEVPMLNRLSNKEQWRVFTNTPAFNGITFNDLLKYTWADDNTTCGVIEE